MPIGVPLRFFQKDQNQGGLVTHMYCESECESGDWRKRFSWRPSVCLASCPLGSVHHVKQSQRSQHHAKGHLQISRA